MKLFYLLSIFLILFACQSITACTCTDYGVPNCKRFSEADAVFVGKIERIVSAAAEKDASVTGEGLGSISWDSMGLISVHFRVEKSFKGVAAAEKIMKVLTYKGTSCDLDVKKGERWVVYASKHEKTGFLSFGACGGNGEVSKDSEEIKELENLAQGTARMTIVGQVARNRYDSVKDAKVYLEGNGLTLSTSTNEGAFYQFEVPQAGKYKIKVVVPFSAALMRYKDSREIKETPAETETVFEYEADVSPGNCDYEFFDTFKIDLKANAVIGFKFSAPGLTEFPKMYPQLCKLQATEQETLAACFTNYWGNPDGSFSFGGYREGRYVIVVSEDDFPEFHAPFMKHYYPGVRNFADAQIINLEQGQKLTLPDFKLPPPIAVQEVKGRLFWKPGKPVLPSDLTEDGVYFEFYNALDKRVSLGMSHYISPSEEEDDGLKLAPDGSFSFRGFVGATYFIRISAENIKGKEYFRELEIKIDENPNFLEVILDQRKKD